MKKQLQYEAGDRNLYPTFVPKILDKLLGKKRVYNLDGSISIYDAEDDDDIIRG